MKSEPTGSPTYEKLQRFVNFVEIVGRDDSINYSDSLLLCELAAKEMDLQVAPEESRKLAVEYLDLMMELHLYLQLIYYKQFANIADIPYGDTGHFLVD